MSNYIKAVDYSVKDGLTTGDPDKIVKGTELDDEFDAIAIAIQTKADLVSPAFLGTPTAPTATGSTNNTQLATTAFVTTAVSAAVAATKEALYPVGSIYTNATNNTNPATLLGFGTWSAFGAGRMMVGFNSSDPLFDSAEETGGSKNAIVVSHTHTAITNTTGSHSHTVTTNNQAAGDNHRTSGFSARSSASDGSFTPSTNSAGDHSHTVTVASTGSSGTNANLPPYITVYLWKRIA
jgi:hypothetical protein